MKDSSLQALHIAFEGVDPEFRVADFDQRHHQQQGHCEYRKAHQDQDSNKIVHQQPPSCGISPIVRHRFHASGGHDCSLPQARMNCNRPARL